MLKIQLIDMPFGSLDYPSFALTQLKFIAKKYFKNLIDIEIVYANHDFALFFGINEYRMVDEVNRYGNNYETGIYNYGIGEWLFQKITFPNWEAPEKEQSYLHSYKHNQYLLEHVLCKRQEIEDFFEHIILKYNMDKKDIIGFTSMFQQNMASLGLARTLKNNNPNTIIFMGGPNCEAARSAVFSRNIEFVDYFFSGPSLVTFKLFLQYILCSKPFLIQTLPGIFCKNSGLPESSVGFQNDINEVDTLDYDDYFLSIDTLGLNNAVNPVLPFETSRGCYWAEKQCCTFCAVNGSRKQFVTMHRDVANKQLQHLSNYASRCKGLRAIDSVIPPEFIEEDFKKFGFENIYYQVRPDLSRTEIKQMSSHGITIVQAGIEALSTQVLAWMNKGTDKLTNILFLKNCSDFSLKVIWNLLYLLPDENPNYYAEYIQLIPLLFHLQPPTGLHEMNYSDFNYYKDNAAHFNLTLEPCTELYKYLYPFGDKEITKLTCFYRIKNKEKILTLYKIKQINKLSKVIDQWKKRHNDIPDYKHSLYLEYPNRIIDNRFPEQAVYNCDNLDLKILNASYKIISLHYLHKALHPIKPSVIEEHINNLIKKGVLLKDQDCLLNLLSDNNK